MSKLTWNNLISAYLEFKHFPTVSRWIKNFAILKWACVMHCDCVPFRRVRDAIPGREDFYCYVSVTQHSKSSLIVYFLLRMLYMDSLTKECSNYYYCWNWMVEWIPKLNAKGQKLVSLDVTSFEMEPIKRWPSVIKCCTLHSMGMHLIVQVNADAFILSSGTL